MTRSCGRSAAWATTAGRSGSVTASMRRRSPPTWPAAIDARVRSELRKLWAILQGPARPPAAREPHVRVGIPLGLASVPAGARRDG